MLFPLPEAGSAGHDVGVGQLSLAGDRSHFSSAFVKRPAAVNA
jgi:hypothetical protein